MPKSEDEFITLGKIGSSYGVQGWMKVLTFTEFGANILDYNPWYLLRQGEWQVFKVLDGKPYRNGVVVKLKGITTPEQVQLLTGSQVGVRRSTLPKLKPGEYYWSDLQGLTVINKDNEVLGIVIYLMETGSNDVLVVKGKKEHAIPYLPGNVILSVDLEKKEIRVDWEQLI